MIKNILIYLVIVGIGYIFYILFIGYLSFYVFLIILSIPIISIILLWIYRNKSRLDFQNNKIQSVQYQDIVLKLTKNSPYMGNSKIKLLNKTILLKEDINDIHYSLKHCGGYHITIDSYKQYDIFNIFSLTRKSNTYTDITIFPYLIDFDFQSLLGNLPDKDNNVYSPNQKGDDPTEIYDIHEYQEGDLLKNIHWKLSLKHNKLLIKDNALPINHPISIHCCFYDSDEDNDYVFQYLNCFCLFLLDNQYSFVLSNKTINYFEEYSHVLTSLLWNKKNISNNTKTLYQYLIDNNGIHFIKG